MMKKNQLITLSLMAAMLSLSACVTDPETGQRTISKAALGGVGGALGGYLLGDLIGGRSDRTEKIVGAGIGALAGAGVGYYMDEQERKLRQQTAGTGVNVIRDGDNLVLDMPSEVTFGVDSANIDAGFRNTLDQVASTLTQYEKTYIDPFGPNSYQTAGFKKKNGKVSAEPTMLSPKHILNLEAVELPEVDEHPEYDITELYDDPITLHTHLKSIIKNGKITKYTMHRESTTIKYRGNSIPLYNYENNKQFKKNKIYWGINKEATADNIVCRIMPVTTDDTVKWIGIYLKTAL
jgi:hypothetical protein